MCDKNFLSGMEWCIKILQKYTNSTYCSFDPRHIALKLAISHLKEKGFLNV